MYFLVKTVDVVILVVGKLLCNHVVVSLQELVAFLLTGLLILKIIGFILVIHLLLEDGMEFIPFLANCCFLKYYHGFIFGHLVNTFQLFLGHRDTIGELLVETLFEDLEGISHGVLTFIPADIGPRRLNTWHGSTID